MSVITPNMNLVLPTIGADSGLAWEQSANSNSLTLDQHNHTAGFGSQIPPAGLNINSALSFNNNSASNVGSILFTDQSSSATLNSLYTVAGELWFTDATRAVQITLGGNVNATSSGVSSGSASAAFSSGVLVVNSAANTPANIQVGSVLLGNNVANSKFLTLSPPAAMPSSYGLVLPNIPGALNFLTIDSSGNMGTASSVSGAQIAAQSLTGSQMANQTITATQMANNTITRAQEAAVGQQVSSSCGTVTRSSGSGAITNLSVTLTTTGRPVMVMFNCDSTGSSASFSAGGNIGVTNNVSILRDGTTIAIYQSTTPASGATFWPASSISFLDTGASAASHTYSAVGGIGGIGTITYNNIVLVAYEL